MAARKTRGVNKLPDDWKEKIRASQIANRFYACFSGEIELRGDQLKAGEILFKRLDPELNRTEHTGKDGGAIETKDITKTDAEILAQYNLQNTKGKK